MTVSDRLLATGRAGAGDCRHVTLRLHPLHGTLNFSGFDTEQWLFAQGVGATGTVVALRACDQLPSGWALLQAWLQRLRDRLRARLEAAVPAAPCTGILVALAVGDQSGVTPAQWQVLWRTGVGHLVSISGVHVTLFASALRVLLEAAWRRSAPACRWLPARHAGALLGFVGALAYALVAGFAVPTRRTLFMVLASGLLGLASVVPRPGLVFSLALAATVVTDPLATLTPSFWLSFGAVGALVLAGLGRFGHQPAWREALSGHWVVGLALLPMEAWWFGQLSLVAPVANAIAVPVVGMLVTPLTLLSLLPGGGWLAVPAERLCDGLLQGLAWLAHPAWAAVDLAQPAPLALGLLTAGILVLLLPWPVPGRTWALLTLLPVWLSPPGLAEGTALIEITDIGQGLAVLVRTRHHALLFDTGPRWPGGDAGSRTLVPLLRAEGVQRLDRLVLSHPDADHVGGADSVLAALSVAQVDAGFPRPGAGACQRDETWRWDGVSFRYLHPEDDVGAVPSHGRAHDRNNHACVLRIAVGTHAVLLPADIEAPAEAQLLHTPDAATSLRADLVVLAHHGSKTSSTPGFVAATGARWAVVSAGWHNHFHHPAPEVVARWQAAGAQVWRTDQDGAIRATLDAQGVQVVDAREARPGFWRSLPSDRTLVP